MGGDNHELKMSTNPKLVLESLRKLKTLFFLGLSSSTQISTQPLSPDLNIFQHCLSIERGKANLRLVEIDWSSILVMIF